MQQRMRRSRLISGLLALGLLAGVVLTAGPAQAVDAIGPYYPTPAWDQKLTPVARFVVLTNWNSQAVLDKETGLVWERSPGSGGLNWSGAARYCLLKNVAGTRGWRLPSVHELASVIDSSVAFPGPTLAPGHPFQNVQLTHYWSATTYAVDPTGAWAVDFRNGNVFGNLKSFTTLQAWCVRGGMHTDAY